MKAFQHLNSIASVSNADAKGIKENIKTAFARFRISSFTSHFLGSNVDGASINMGIHCGLGALIKKEAPWLSLVHSFKGALLGLRQFLVNGCPLKRM